MILYHCMVCVVYLYYNYFTRRHALHTLKSYSETGEINVQLALSSLPVTTTTTITIIIISIVIINYGIIRISGNNVHIIKLYTIRYQWSQSTDDY